MKRMHSGRMLLLRYLGILLAVTLLCLLFGSVYSVWVYHEQLQYCNEATQAVCTNSLRYALRSLEEFNRDVYSNDTDFRMLSSETRQTTAGQRASYLFNLRRLMDNRVPSTGAILLFNSSSSVFYFCYGSSFFTPALMKADMDMMHSLAEDLKSRPDAELNSWRVFASGDKVLLVNCYRLRDAYMCSMLDLSSFADTYAVGTENMQYAFYTDEQVLTNQSYLSGHGIALADLRKGTDEFDQLFTARNLIESEYLPEYGIGLASIIPVSGIWGYSQMYLLIITGALILILMTFWAIYRVFHQALIYPLAEITTASRRLANSGEAEPEEHEDLEELVAIRTALNQLVEQKVELTRENENRTLEKEHALLQYYQLQTRSHFFLNCLKSIYSMTTKGEVEKTKRMIMVFSSHIRYIFHDTLSLVSLRSELDEVNDYYQIIQLDRRSPVLLNLDVPKELEDCLVPPLTIQTFAENTYKYNRDEKKILRLSVQADSIQMDEKHYLRLRISDNGIGYSEELLQKLQEPPDVFSSQHVGISNLRQRISILFHNDYQIAFFNGTNGGAVTVIYLPLTRGETEER